MLEMRDIDGIPLIAEHGENLLPNQRKGGGPGIGG